METQSNLAVPLALFPLQTVLFPGNRLPLRIFEARYVDLVGQCMRDSSRFGVVGIAHGSEAGSIPEIFDIGTSVDIIDFDQGNDGLLNIIIQGRQRFEVQATEVAANNLLQATVCYLPMLDSPAVTAAPRILLDVFAELRQQPELKARIPETSDALEMAYQIIPWLPLAATEKNRLLALDSASALIDEVVSQLNHLTQQRPN